MNMRTRTALAAFTVLCAGFCWPALGQDMVLARASAAEVIKNNNLDASREAALAEAKMRCLKEVLKKDILKPDDYQKNQEMLEKTILANPDAFLARSDVENEEIIDDGQRYSVQVSARVRKGAINAALLEQGIGDPLALVPKPTVMVLIRERFETRVSGTRACETTVINLLQDKGFTVIDPEQKKVLDLRNQLYAQGSGDMSALLQTAMSFNADYLIQGDATVSSSAPLGGTDLKARMATVALKIVEASSGKVIAAASGEGNAKHLDELVGGNWALEDAGKAAAAQVISRFEKLLKDEALAGGAVLVDFHGLEFESQVQEAQKLLTDIENATAVVRRFSFSGMAEFVVKYRGETSQLTAALRNAEVDGKAVEVVEVFPRYVRLKRVGAPAVANVGSPELLRKYLEEKFKQFDMEKAREADAQLATKIAELNANTKINDEQKKQLAKAQAEIEQTRQEVAKSQKDLEKRTAEMNSAQAQKAEAERKLAEANKKVEEAKSEHQASLQEASSQQAVCEREVSNTGQRAYVAKRNHSNSRASADMSAGEMIGAVSKGLDVANKIGSSIESFSSGNIGGGLSGLAGGLGGLF